MKTQDYFTATFLVKATPEATFVAINNVRTWWTEDLKGNSEKIGDEFEVQFGDVHYSKQRLIEVVQNEKVTWLVTDSRLNFIADKSEWTNTKVMFEISKEGSNTRLRFTHVGLAPQVECYDACSNAWSGYINDSLKKLIESSSS